jgi:GNAT superfamily N-acetyltransferase
MSAEAELFYFQKPSAPRPVSATVGFLPVQEFLADEPACKQLWELVSTQFRTRGKFLAVWSSVRFVAVSRDPDGAADGFLLVSTPVSWQIDYVVVRPDRRGNGIAAALVTAALNQAYLLGAPCVTLTSKESLRGLYEGCGFTVLARHSPDPVPVSRIAPAP